MASLNVEVVHQRIDYRRCYVDIEGSLSEGTKVLVERVREHLYNTDYETYCFVTENPKPKRGSTLHLYPYGGSDADR